MLATLLFALALAQPAVTTIAVGGTLDSPFLRNFHRPEQNAETSFRWSQPEAELVLPGVGSSTTVELRLTTGHPGTPVTLNGGGESLLVETGPGWNAVRLLPQAAPGSGDVAIRISAPRQSSPDDPRPRGVALSHVVLRSDGGDVPWVQAGLLGLSVALLTFTLARTSRRPALPWVAGGMACAGLLAALLLDGGAWRPYLTIYSGRLALVLLLTLLMHLAAEGLLAWLARRGWLATAAAKPLAGLAALAFFVRLAATSYPLIFMLDPRYHLARASLIPQGRFLELFLPNQSLTPQQWNAAVTIPYSPFFYLLSFPVTYLPQPWDRLAMLAMGAAVDGFAVLLIGCIAVLGGLGRRAAFFAALLLAIMPYGLWWAVSWGLFPNLLGQCLTLLAVAAWLRLYPRLHERRAQLLLAVTMTLAYLSYATSMMFLGVTWLLLLGLLALRRDQALGPTLRAGLWAALAATVLYYGWHVPALVSQSLPTLLGALGGSGELKGASESAAPPGLAQLIGVLPLRFDGLLLLLSACGGLLLLCGDRRRETGDWGQHSALGRKAASVSRLRSPVPPLGGLLLAWCLVYPIFALVDYYVPLVEKQAMHLIPAVALLGGLALAQLWRGRWGRLVASAILAFFTWQALSSVVFWVVVAYAAEK
ncbi:MAG: hypothetical protein MUD01_14730 [Chloroflexaceae bacterium]|jgi:hypothetical protein|nr:hypothetical protein [Chloroflexaceae bacterium]